jgi:hypothetical protein
MMRITGKQERFCRSVALGKKWVVAYKEAFDTTGMKQNTIYRKANELKNMPKITARIEQLGRGECDDPMFNWTRKQAVLCLRNVIDMSEKNPHNTRLAMACIKAVKTLNKMHGYDKPQSQPIMVQIPAEVKSQPVCESEWLNVDIGELFSFDGVHHLEFER